MLSSIRDWPRLIDKKIFRGFSLSAVRECSRQTAKSTRRKSNRIHADHQLLNATRNRSCDYMLALYLLVVINLSAIVCGSFLGYLALTGRQRREISLFMKIFEGVVVVLLFAIPH
ncbi:hypothetical protein Q9W35_001750 [Salmonella enterica]|nr:hypothetical protein [Salmonella enterica]